MTPAFRFIPMCKCHVAQSGEIKINKSCMEIYAITLDRVSVPGPILRDTLEKQADEDTTLV